MTAVSKGGKAATKSVAAGKAGSKQQAAASNKAN